MVKGQERDEKIRIAIAKKKLLRLALFTIAFCEELLQIIRDEGMGFVEVTTLDAPLSEDTEGTLHDITPDERTNGENRAISSVLMEQIRGILGKDWKRKIEVITLYLNFSKNNLHNWPTQIKKQTGYEASFIAKTIRVEYPRLLKELQIMKLE